MIVSCPTTRVVQFSLTEITLLHTALSGGANLDDRLFARALLNSKGLLDMTPRTRDGPPVQEVLLETGVNFDLSDRPLNCTLNKDQFTEWLEAHADPLTEHLCLVGTSWIRNHLEAEGLLETPKPRQAPPSSGEKSVKKHPESVKKHPSSTTLQPRHVKLRHPSNRQETPDLLSKLYHLLTPALPRRAFP